MKIRGIFLGLLIVAGVALSNPVFAVSRFPRGTTTTVARQSVAANSTGSATIITGTDATLLHVNVNCDDSTTNFSIQVEISNTIVQNIPCTGSTSRIDFPANIVLTASDTLKINGVNTALVGSRNMGYAVTWVGGDRNTDGDAEDPVDVGSSSITQTINQSMTDGVSILLYFGAFIAFFAAAFFPFRRR